MNWIGAIPVGLTMVGAGLLVSAGSTKALGGSSPWQRFLGVAETLVGVTAIVGGSLRLTSGLIGVVYSAFFIVLVVRLRRTGSWATCECFGEEGAITGEHVAVVLAVALAGILSALVPSDEVSRLPRSHGPAAAIWISSLLAGLLVQEVLMSLRTSITAWARPASTEAASWTWH
jgi:hypothetical protein